MCRLEAAGYLRIQQGQPIRTPFWAAGLAFSTAEAVREVPYDRYTPYLFDGEEISTAARLWTHGYDFYAPITDTVFHVYESAYKRNKYWEIDWQERSAIQMRRSAAASAKKLYQLCLLSVFANPPDGAWLDHRPRAVARAVLCIECLSRVSLPGLGMTHPPRSSQSQLGPSETTSCGNPRGRFRQAHLGAADWRCNTCPPCPGGSCRAFRAFLIGSCSLR